MYRFSPCIVVFECYNKVLFSIYSPAVCCQSVPVPLCRFDLSQCKWEQLPDMLCQRDYFSAVCLDGKVFALGGNRDDSQNLDAVEYYTPEDNTWRYSITLVTYTLFCLF